MMEPVARAKVNSSVLRRSDAPHEVPETGGAPKGAIHADDD
jgi:hypothetical protein